MRTTGKARTLLLSLTFVLASACLWAAVTGAVDGVVKDSATGQPVAGVKITLVSARSETLSYVLTTDQKGHFYKSGLVPGVYKMTLEKEGYVPQGGSIRVVLDETVVQQMIDSLPTQAPVTLIAHSLVAGKWLICGESGPRSDRRAGERGAAGRDGCDHQRGRHRSRI